MGGSLRFQLQAFYFSFFTLFTSHPNQGETKEEELWPSMAFFPFCRDYENQPEVASLSKRMNHQQVFNLGNFQGH